jgi:hypothetical protein
MKKRTRYISAATRARPRSRAHTHTHRHTQRHTIALPTTKSEANTTAALHEKNKQAYDIGVRLRCSYLVSSCKLHLHTAYIISTVPVLVLALRLCECNTVNACSCHVGRSEANVSRKVAQLTGPRFLFLGTLSVGDIR